MDVAPYTLAYIISVVYCSILEFLAIQQQTRKQLTRSVSL